MEYMFKPLARYAEFSGRSRRMEFWLWVLFQFLLGGAFLVAIISLAGSAFLSSSSEQAWATGGAFIGLIIIWLLVSLVFFIPNLAVTVRRLHDSNRSGWWIMLYWGPYLFSMMLLPVLTQFDSNESFNTMASVSTLLSGGSMIGCLVLLVFLFLDGTPGPNAYGPDPKGRADAGNVFA